MFLCINCEDSGECFVEVNRIYKDKRTIFVDKEVLISETNF